ncbi:hypothetical protein [Alkalimarinus coralli]|uniref:hypothetical protein n=1 Tax=Alkalimarinus coralli TaxID=2935863 RepID=UPI00202B979A|nr:hypothetical protein [Alkalimarinus coralli]
MSQKEHLQEIELTDLIRFLVERWGRLLSVLLIVSILVFLSLTGKQFIVHGSFVNEPDIAKGVSAQAYRASALVELGQVLTHGGDARPIVSPDLLVEIYSTDELELSVFDAGEKDNPPNGLWVSAENEVSADAESLVKSATEAIVAHAHGKEQAAKQNKNKAYSVIGITRVAKLEVIEPEVQNELLLGIKLLFKFAMLSIIIGFFASLFYAIASKIYLDYKTKYPS